MGQNDNNTNASIKHALFISMCAFLLAVGIGVGSQGLLKNISSLILAFTLLTLIILIGIIFDIIGTAVAAATEVPFHAKAARKVSGAKQAILLIRNADKVANFCNDVVGDVSGTLSGAIGATIISSLILSGNESHLVIGGTIMTGFIAALTVGGKALGKSFAINEADNIIFKVGKILAWVENIIRINLLWIERKKGRKT
ncbi:hypothetical protein RDV78_06275 [Bacillota bacterium LX-D]|nr:hypothetical protein [Bacillota bacterium LX-D]